MVYNAMKLFMEVNPQLFDECSHDYTETQNNAEAVKASRQAKWDRLTQLAESMKQNGHAPATSRAPGSYSKSSVKAPAAIAEDEESRARMEQLRLQDRPGEHERHSSSVR